MMTAESENSGVNFMPDNELIDLLKGETDFTLEEYGSLDEVLQNIESEFCERISKFAGIPVQVTLREIEMVSPERPLANAPGGQLFAEFLDTEQNRSCILSMPGKLYYFLLDYALGGNCADEPNDNQTHLSEAEITLFVHFCQIISNGLRAAVSPYSDMEALVPGYVLDEETFEEWKDENKLVTINLTLAAESESALITLLVPIEFLEPMRAAPSSWEAPTAEPVDAAWAREIVAAVDRTVVPLHMILGQAEMSIGQIDSLAPQQLLDVGVTLSNLIVADTDGNELFLANLEKNQKTSKLTVTGGVASARKDADEFAY